MRGLPNRQIRFSDEIVAKIAVQLQYVMLIMEGSRNKGTQHTKLKIRSIKNHVPVYFSENGEKDRSKTSASKMGIQS